MWSKEFLLDVFDDFYIRWGCALLLIGPTNKTFGWIISCHQMMMGKWGVAYSETINNCFFYLFKQSDGGRHGSIGILIALSLVVCFDQCYCHTLDMCVFYEFFCVGEWESWNIDGFRWVIWEFYDLVAIFVTCYVAVPGNPYKGYVFTKRSCNVAEILNIPYYIRRIDYVFKTCYCA